MANFNLILLRYPIDSDADRYQCNQHHRTIGAAASKVVIRELHRTCTALRTMLMPNKGLIRPHRTPGSWKTSRHARHTRLDKHSAKGPSNILACTQLIYLDTLQGCPRSALWVGGGVGYCVPLCSMILYFLTHRTQYQPNALTKTVAIVEFPLHVTVRSTQIYKLIAFNRSMIIYSNFFSPLRHVMDGKSFLRLLDLSPTS